MLNSQIIERMNEFYAIENREASVIDFRSASEELEKFKELQRMSDEERNDLLLEEEIEHFWEQRENLREDKHNSWRVYSICKTVSKIARLSNSNFRELALVDKVIQMARLLKFVDEDTLFKGIREFHLSPWNEVDMW
jgi:hypothetical protein